MGKLLSLHDAKPIDFRSTLWATFALRPTVSRLTFTTSSGKPGPNPATSVAPFFSTLGKLPGLAAQAAAWDRLVEPTVTLPVCTHPCTPSHREWVNHGGRIHGMQNASATRALHQGRLMVA